MIDFTAQGNATTYSGRQAHASWEEQITSILDPSGLRVVDIGCGGGIYARAWRELGAAHVTGVDSSGPILENATSEHHHEEGLRFIRGEATATGLDSGSADVVFARALVHHLEDLPRFTEEAVRLLRPGGQVIIQDRTIDDVSQPADHQHLRGWFFTACPRLLEVEAARRPASADVIGALEAAGCQVAARSFWEVRAHHEDREVLLAEIAARTGRSILHELDDAELAALVSQMRTQLPQGPVVETDRWTLWAGTTPGASGSEPGA